MLVADNEMQVNEAARKNISYTDTHKCVCVCVYNIGVKLWLPTDDDDGGRR